VVLFAYQAHEFCFGAICIRTFSTFVLAVYSKAGTRQTPQTLTVFSISIQQPISI
jgi:hypothetical protein